MDLDDLPFDLLSSSSSVPQQHGKARNMQPASKPGVVAVGASVASVEPVGGNTSIEKSSYLQPLSSEPGAGSVGSIAATEPQAVITGYVRPSSTHG